VPLTQLAWETSHPHQEYWVKYGTFVLAAEQATGSLGPAMDPHAVGVFAVLPQTQLNAWRVDEGDSLASEAADYLFARYVADRFGGPSALATVIAEPGRGIAAYEQLFRSYLQPTTFDAVFGDWVAANVLGNLTLDDGHFGYRGNFKVDARVHPGP